MYRESSIRQSYTYNSSSHAINRTCTVLHTPHTQFNEMVHIPSKPSVNIPPLPTRLIAHSTTKHSPDSPSKDVFEQPNVPTSTRRNNRSSGRPMLKRRCTSEATPTAYRNHTHTHKKNLALRQAKLPVLIRASDSFNEIRSLSAT